ncbi:exonuclease/endonuclease/phosphatase family protein [Nocardioides maradonensis]
MRGASRQLLPAVLVVALAAATVSGVGHAADLRVGVRAGVTTAPQPCATGDTGGPDIQAAGSGRFGTGTVLGALPSDVAAPVGPAVQGQVRLVSANLPNRTSGAGFAWSMRRIVGASPDFITLNEVSGRSDAALATSARGYDVYRDPVVDVTAGGRPQSMENAVLWNASRWHLLDGGRVKTVDDDAGFYFGRPYLWDRYATWVVLQRGDGAVVSVISAHMPINPVKNPQQHGRPRVSRVAKYDNGMRVILGLAHELQAYGPVLIGGDMNSHAGGGAWTAASIMHSAGFGYTSDGILMFDFFPPGVSVAAHGRFPVASDHPALWSTFDMNGVGGTGAATSPSSSPRSAPAKLPSGAALTTRTLSTAATLIDRGRAARLPAQAWVDAVAAALADGGHRRISEHAADGFYRRLRHQPWRMMTVPEADGAVTGAPFPEVYAAREADARYLITFLRSGGASCDSDPLGTCPPALDFPTEGPILAAAQMVVRCVHDAFPSLKRVVVSRSGYYCAAGRVVSGLDLPLPARARGLGARVAQYLRIHATELDVAFVVHDAQTWAADQPEAGWRPYAATDGSRTAAGLVRDRVFVAVNGGSC